MIWLFQAYFKRVEINQKKWIVYMIIWLIQRKETLTYLLNIWLWNKCTLEIIRVLIEIFFCFDILYFEEVYTYQDFNKILDIVM